MTKSGEESHVIEHADISVLGSVVQVLQIRGQSLCLSDSCIVKRGQYFSYRFAVRLK